MRYIYSMVNLLLLCVVVDIIWHPFIWRIVSNLTVPGRNMQNILKYCLLQIQEVDGEKLWHKYEVLMSGLAQCLCDELRLVLLPTQASQLKYCLQSSVEYVIVCYYYYYYY